MLDFVINIHEVVFLWRMCVTLFSALCTWWVAAFLGRPRTADCGQCMGLPLSGEVNASRSNGCAHFVPFRI